MPTTPFYLQQFRFLDGSLASGGKLYATVQGTETPAVIYLNPTLTTPAPQPLVLSADGIVPQFWAPTIPGLRFKLYDPRNGVDTLVWTRDYISDGAGVNAPGTVTSVGLALGTAMDAIANVSSSPVVTSGNIGLELADQPSGKALMSPVSGTGKPSFRAIEQSDIPGGPFLPLAGGEMAPSAAIQWPDGGSGAVAFNDDGGSWTNLERTQLYFSPSASRSGAFLQTHEYGGSQFGLTTKAASGTLDVLLYGNNGGGGYATFNRRNGDLAVALGAGYGDNGEIRVENASGAETFKHSSEFDSTHLSGALVAGSIRSNAGVSTGAPSVERINALGAGFLSALSISGLTNGAIPLVSTAGGLLGNSSLSEDATSVKSAKPVEVNALYMQVSSDVGSAANIIRGTYGYSSDLALRVTGSPFTGTQRWILRRNATPESGSNAGSDLDIVAIGDAPGAVIDTPVRIYRAEGGQIQLNRPVRSASSVLQYTTEPVTSGRYVKTTDTTIGPSATAKASLLNGATTGFTAVTDPAQRWNALGAASETVLKGNVSSAANQVIVFELYRNGAVSATLTLPARSYGTATPWRLVIDHVVRVAGSTGTVRVKMRAYVTADNTSSAASVYDMSATLTGVDLTVAHTWDVVCTIPNNASNSITCDYAKKIG